MAENEPDRFILVQQTFLVLHDQLISIIISLGRTRRVLERRRLAAFDLGEVRPAKLARILRQQLLVAGVLGPLFNEYLVEPAGKVTVRIVVGRTVAKVAGNFVHEEQAEHLDPPPPEQHGFAQVLPDRLTDHLLINRPGRRAKALPLVEEPVLGEVDIGRFNAHLIDPPPLVDGVVRQAGIREFLMLLHTHNPAGDSAVSRADRQFQPRRPGRLPPDLHQLDVGGGVRSLLLHVRDHDLLHQTQIVSIHRVQPVHHIALLRVRCAIAQRKHRIKFANRRLGQ